MIKIFAAGIVMEDPTNWDLETSLVFAANLSKSVGHVTVYSEQAYGGEMPKAVHFADGRGTEIVRFRGPCHSMLELPSAY